MIDSVGPTRTSSIGDESAISTSREKVASSSRFSLLLSFLIPAANRNDFYNWYAYLRWIDDIVDNAPAGDLAVKTLLERHRQIARGVSFPQSCDPPGHEAILLQLVAPGRNAKAPSLSDSIADMLDCIAYDAERRGRIEPQARLQFYWDKEVRSYLGAIAVCCGVDATRGLTGLSAARGAKIVHIVRDLTDDIRDGLINISAELGAAAKITSDDPNSASLEGNGAHGIWGLLRHADTLLDGGLGEMRPQFSRFQLIVLLLISKYQCISKVLQRPKLSKSRAVRTFDLARQFARNLFVALALNGRARTGNFPPAIALSLVRRVNLLTALLPFCSPSEMAEFRSASRGVTLHDGHRVRRRFRVACLMGRTSFAAVAPLASRNRDLRRAAGLLYGFWATAAIELDRVMDDSLIANDAAHAATWGWLEHQLAILVNESPSEVAQKKIAEAGTCFSSFARAYMETLSRFLALVERTSASSDPELVRREFQMATAALMAGQLRSIGQATPHHNPDWSWYRTEILNNKNVQFLLAPMNLWCVDAGSGERLLRLVQGFNKLNRYYLHYQLIDDVADMLEDTQQGIVGAPGAVLLSQAQFARQVLDSAACRADLGSAAWESGLLSDQLADAPIYDSFRPYLGEAQPGVENADALDGRIRCALINRSDELAIPIETLAKMRLQEGTKYIASIGSRDAPTALDCLLRSGAPERLVGAVGHPGHRSAVLRHMAHQTDTPLSEFLFVLERLMRHTLSAARGAPTYSRT